MGLLNCKNNNIVHIFFHSLYVFMSTQLKNIWHDMIIIIIKDILYNCFTNYNK